MSRDCVGVGDSCAQPHGSGGGGAEARGSVVAKADARNVRSAPGGGSALMISSDLVLSGLVFSNGLVLSSASTAHRSKEMVEGQRAILDMVQLASPVS
jgi:hypothetical protein